MAFKSKNYLISEGNQIGYLPTEFGATGNSIVEKKIVASENLLKGQLVEITGDLQIGVAKADSQAVVGVAMFDAKAGEPTAFETEGLMKLVSAGTITAGDKLSSAAEGKVAKASTGQVIGIALSSATTDADVYVKFSI